MNNKPLPLLTSREAAEYLGITLQTLNNWRYLKTQNVPHCVRMRNRYRYRLKDLNDFLEGKPIKVQKVKEPDNSVVLQQYDIETGDLYDICYANGKKVWSKKHEQESNG